MSIIGEWQHRTGMTDVTTFALKTAPRLKGRSCARAEGCGCLCVSYNGNSQLSMIGGQLRIVEPVHVRHGKSESANHAEQDQPVNRDRDPEQPQRDLDIPAYQR